MTKMKTIFVVIFLALLIPVLLKAPESVRRKYTVENMQIIQNGVTIQKQKRLSLNVVENYRMIAMAVRDGGTIT